MISNPDEPNGTTDDNLADNFCISFATVNAAFVGGGNAEVARILRRVADQVEGGTCSGSCRDLNGNKVGEFQFTTEQSGD